VIPKTPSHIAKENQSETCEAVSYLQAVSYLLWKNSQKICICQHFFRLLLHFPKNTI